MKLKFSKVNGEYYGDNILKYIDNLHNGIYELEIKKERTKRSDQQNKYYWGVVIELFSDYTGYTKQEAHDIFKFEFLLSKIEKNGFRFTIQKDTKTLDTKEFEEYCDNIRLYCSKFGLIIPKPNE